MSQELEDTIKKIERVIADRAIVGMSAKQAQRFEADKYRPFFSLVDREGELFCVNTQGRRRKKTIKHLADIEILRFSRPEKGFFCEATEEMSWANVAIKVAKYFDWPL